MVAVGSALTESGAFAVGVACAVVVALAVTKKESGESRKNEMDNNVVRINFFIIEVSITP